ncbi:hypothetical protein OG432_16250 [Streptomyces sp. NBC_00442]
MSASTRRWPTALRSRPHKHFEVAVGTAPRGAQMWSQATGRRPSS